jgi:4,5-DOPA dioxygenase extradiol
MHVDRRQALQWLGGLALSACTNFRREKKDVVAMTQTPNSPVTELPVLFAAHGAPMLLEDAEWLGQLADWSKSLPRPKSILVVSAHWEHRPIALGATKPVPLVYDFYGFPERFYKTKYAAPGAPELAARVRALLREKAIPFVDEPERGLDHGAYVPLVAMYPEAPIPVLQLSLPALVPGTLVELGRALAPLREEGVLIFGSGFLTHNMRYAFRQGIPGWAQEFDDWIAGAITRLDLDALKDFQTKAPAVKLALPTWEHYAPLLVTAGAAVNGRSTPNVAYPISGWWMNTPFTKRSVQFG